MTDLLASDAILTVTVILEHPGGYMTDSEASAMFFETKYCNDIKLKTP